LNGIVAGKRLSFQVRNGLAYVSVTNVLKILMKWSCPPKFTKATGI